jgi:methylase of polypeptide subunit release factors
MKISLKSQRGESLRKTVEGWPATAPVDRWCDLLRNDKKYLSDPIGAIGEWKSLTENQKQLFEKYETFNSWLIDAQNWTMNIQDPMHQSSKLELALFQLWNFVAGQIRHALRQAKISSPTLQDPGFLLYFADGLSKCVVIRYRFAEAVPSFIVEDVIDNPSMFFDPWAHVEGDQRRKSLFKNVMNSGQKLVLIRGVLIHVDRQLDEGVFGPSIDTLVLAETIAQHFIEDNIESVKNAMEIGSGNGLLSCILSRHISELKRLVGVDTDFRSIACTNRNLNINLRETGDGPFPTNYLLHGPYDASLFNPGFDIVVSNPPYLPLSPKQIAPAGSSSRLFQKVGGTELLTSLIRSAPDILTDTGRLYLITSSTSLKETYAAVPPGYRCEPLCPEGGVQVPFEVEDVLSNGDWLNYLVSERGLEKQGTNSYRHYLFPMCIQREQRVQ